MKPSKVLKAILIVSGLVLMGVGGAILVAPVAFFAEEGIDLRGKTNLLNEIRAPGALLFASGAVIVVGAFVARLTFAASVLSPLVYLAYGIARSLSMWLDGVPTTGLVEAMVVELAIGLVAIFALLKYRKPT
jgi:Domain of unknown function (DUF4345)